ncbi:MAG: transcriptional regulator NrdR [Candidatus Woesearchaeota archaeon]
MKCAYCQDNNTRVIETREAGETTRRRRECESCKQRFTTYERVEQQALRIIKRDNSRELFDRNKLLRGITTACEKRPVSTQEIEEAAQRIERDLRSKGEQEIPSNLIGEYVMKELRELDEVAYIRFASVYKQFTDVKSFKQEIDSLSKKK